MSSFLLCVCFGRQLFLMLHFICATLYFHWMILFSLDYLVWIFMYQRRSFGDKREPQWANVTEVFPPACSSFYCYSLLGSFSELPSPYKVVTDTRYEFSWLVRSCSVFAAAQGELQRMAADLLHFLPAACGILCAQHVCGSGGGELPQVPGVPRERGESHEGCQAPGKTGEKTKEWAWGR